MGEIRFCIGDVRDGETRVGGLRLADGRISDSIFESRRRVERFSESAELWCGRYSTPCQISTADRTHARTGPDTQQRLVVGCKLNFAAVTRRSPSDKSRLYADHSPCTGNSIQFFSFFFLSDVTVTTASVSQSLSVISRSRSALTPPPFLLIIFSYLNDERQVEA